MARNNFDQLAKQYLEEFLAPLGQVTRNLEIPGETKFADIYFTPTTVPDADWGLLGRVVQTACSLEPFHNAPTRQDIRTCLLKLLWVQETDQRKAKQTKEHLKEDDLPRLWILAAKTTRKVLEEAGAFPHPDWPQGVYLLQPLLRTGIIALDELPETPETLWLRILGRGRTLERAIHEVLALPPKHPKRFPTLRLLANWKIRVDLKEIRDVTKRETIMALSQAFLEWEQQVQENSHQEGRQEGRQEGFETGQQRERRSLLSLLLTQRFGPLPEPLQQTLGYLDLDRLEALALSLFNFTEQAEVERWVTEALGSQMLAQWGDRLGKLPVSLQTQLQNQLPRQSLANLNALYQAMADLLDPGAARTETARTETARTETARAETARTETANMDAETAETETEAETSAMRLIEEWLAAASHPSAPVPYRSEP